jgi:hypothetical protein
MCVQLVSYIYSGWHMNICMQWMATMPHLMYIPCIVKSYIFEWGGITWWRKWLVLGWITGVLFPAGTWVLLLTIISLALVTTQLSLQCMLGGYFPRAEVGGKWNWLIVSSLCPGLQYVLLAPSTLLWIVRQRCNCTYFKWYDAIPRQCSTFCTGKFVFFKIRWMVLENSKCVVSVGQLYVLNSISVIFVSVDSLFLFTVDSPFSAETCW